MDKRPAGLVIAAAVTVVGIAWASAQEHKPTRLPPYFWELFRDVPPYSETDFRLGDHQQFKGHFFGGSRGRPR